MRWCSILLFDFEFCALCASCAVLETCQVRDLHVSVLCWMRSARDVPDNPQSNPVEDQRKICFKIAHIIVCLRAWDEPDEQWCQVHYQLVRTKKVNGKHKIFSDVCTNKNAGHRTNIQFPQALAVYTAFLYSAGNIDWNSSALCCIFRGHFLKLVLITSLPANGCALHTLQFKFRKNHL